MAVFPAIAAVHSAPKRTSAPGSVLSLGDGYKRTAVFGISGSKPEWQLTWEVNAFDASTIDAFLQAQAEAGTSFDWQPPDSATLARWRCDEWSVEQQAAVLFVVSATFRRVFELATSPILIPEATTCPDDELCPIDTGFIGYTTGGVFGTCTIIDEDVCVFGPLPTPDGRSTFQSTNVNNIGLCIASTRNMPLAYAVGTLYDLAALSGGFTIIVSNTVRHIPPDPACGNPTGYLIRMELSDRLS